jgi:4-aminobutyrate aminotransferase-like enzyme
MSRWPKGSHGGTYGGNPIGCAAALATIEVLTEAGFLDNVEARGRQLLDGLEQLAADDEGVSDVRGLGLMVAAEFADPDSGLPDAARVAAIQRHCLEEGRLILMNAGTYGNVVRWMPPLVVSEAEVDRALEAFALALKETRRP